MKLSLLIMFILTVAFTAFAQVPAPSVAPVAAPAVVASAGVWAWLVSNWQAILVAVLAVDQVLIGLFPKNALLGNLSELIKKVLPSKPA